MPGTFNPVSGNPVASVSHSKSFRSLLGFGGNNGGGTSIKPSFFSQLNLKAGRRSFGGPPDFHANDRPVLVIDPEPDYENTRQENRVVLNDDTRTTRLEQMPFSSSPTKETSNRASHKITHSLLPGPIDTHIPSYSLNSHTDLDVSLARGLTAESRVDPDTSGFSKHLPDLSNDFPLLIDEQLPSDTASQSDHPDSQVFPEPHPGTSSLPPLPRSPKKIERQDLTQRVYTTAPTLSSLPQDSHELSNSGPLCNSVDASMDITASFDLSGARLSLDLIRQEFGDDWAKNVVVESGSAPSAGTSALLPAESSLMGSGNGPITSTPFRNPRAPFFGFQQKEPEVSFNLDALDPDLVALLRQNNANKGPSPITHIIAPSPLEPFAPPPDPLNPGTAAKHLAVSVSPSPSPPLPSVPAKREASTPSPARKFATISTSTSPAKQPRLHRSQIDQDVFSPSKLPKPALAPAISSDLHWDDNRRHSDEQPSPSSAMTYSEVVTPSDISKPSPLSAMPLTLDDIKRNPVSNAIQSSIASTSTWNNTTRRKGRTAVPLPIQSPRPVSTLTSSIDSRPSAYHMHRNRDRDLRPASASPEVHATYTHTFGSTGRDCDHVRTPVNGLFSKQPSPDRGTGCPSSAGAGQLPSTLHERVNSNDALLHSQDRDRGSPSARRYRKRSMSLDQRSSGLEGRADDFYSQGGFHPRFRGRDREGVAESVGHIGSEYAHSVTSGLGTPYDGRDVEKDRERYLYGNGYHERERPGRLHTDWLGPRTAKAFAAAGLLDDAKDIPGSRYGAFSRSTSDRDFRTPGAESNRDRRSPVHRGYPSLDGERDRRYSVATSGRSSDRDFRPSGARSGTMSPSTVVSARPLSRHDSWSSRPPQVFARTISDLLSQRGSTDGRDSASGVHPRTGSVYSAGGGGTAAGSTGSGGGRASPTTTSSHIAVQPQIQALKEKHDIQTEALLAALADSQRTARELKEENDSLKSQIRSLEERLVETIASFRRKEKELTRVLRTKRQSSPDRTRIAVSHFESQSSINSRHPPPNQSARTTSTKRRFSTTSSVFPPIPGSMSLLMAETPGPQHDSGTSSSPPASPTLVLPKLSSKQKSPERQRLNGDHVIMSSSQPVSISHKRSTSGASVATSTNFSFETGSPGSLKLKPEHELLLGDMTRFSLATGFDGDSEVET